MSKLQQIQQLIEAVRVDNLKGVNRDQIEKQLFEVEKLVHEVINEDRPSESLEEEEKPHPHKIQYDKIKSTEWPDWDELPFMLKADLGDIFDQIDKKIFELIAATV